MGEDLIMLVTLAFFLFAIGYLVFAIIAHRQDRRKRKEDESFHYRKHVANMFIAGRVKQIAKDQGIDIKEESNDFGEYMHWYKDFDSRSNKKQDIDDKIEDDLAIQIDEMNEEVDKKKA